MDVIRTHAADAIARARYLPRMISEAAELPVRDPALFAGAAERLIIYGILHDDVLEELHDLSVVIEAEIEADSETVWQCYDYDDGSDAGYYGQVFGGTARGLMVLRDVLLPALRAAIEVHSLIAAEKQIARLRAAAA